MTVITLQVNSTTDDARNLTPNSTFNSNNSTYRLGNDAGADQFCGWLWHNVTVPQGATINSSTLDFFSAQTGMGTTANVIFYGEKSANPVTFSNTTANKPEGRIRTTASVTKNFNVANFNSASSFGLDPVDVTTLVQEIVNQATFASGNSLVLVGHDNGSAASNNIGITNFEATGNLKGAKLTIDYTAGGVTPPSNVTYITYRPPFLS